MPNSSSNALDNCAVFVRYYCMFRCKNTLFEQCIATCLGTATVLDEDMCFNATGRPKQIVATVKLHTQL